MAKNVPTVVFRYCAQPKILIIDFPSRYTHIEQPTDIISDWGAYDCIVGTRSKILTRIVWGDFNLTRGGIKTFVRTTLEGYFSDPARQICAREKEALYEQILKDLGL
jgi:hypothetical protein